MALDTVDKNAEKSISPTNLYLLIWKSYFEVVLQYNMIQLEIETTEFAMNIISLISIMHDNCSWLSKSRDGEWRYS